MEKYLQYIPYIVGILLIVGGAIYNIAKRPAKIKEWLIWACAQAEQQLGSGTGLLKLHAVYDMFVKQWPMMALFISFERFQSWVDFALEKLEDWIQNSPEIEFAITGEVAEDEEIIEEE